MKVETKNTFEEADKLFFDQIEEETDAG